MLKNKAIGFQSLTGENFLYKVLRPPFIEGVFILGHDAIPFIIHAVEMHLFTEIYKMQSLNGNGALITSDHLSCPTFSQ